MTAQAMSLHLPQPTEEVRVVHNPANPERPSVVVVRRDDVSRESQEMRGSEGELIAPKDAPANAAIKLGYRCAHCGTISSFKERTCLKCGKPKAAVPEPTSNPFSDILGGIFEVTINQLGLGENRVTSTRKVGDREEVVAYERANDMILCLDEKALEKRRDMEKRRPQKVLIPIDRKTFVLATGASETELLGDVRHDPYGGHPQLGTPQYERVIAGAVHEAHQGVLFIDEIPHLGQLQRFILTAMQERRYPIAGRNPQSAGASVRVDGVPCDFIFVGACNIQDIVHILSPFRSRIAGSGYEILLETTMPDDDSNRAKLAQFIAQEIQMDARIPPAERGAVCAIIEEAKRRAKVIDNQQNALTLRLRELGGVVRAAGDIAVNQKAKHITQKHIEAALKRARPIEEQIKAKYGSLHTGMTKDVSPAQRESMQYYNVDEHLLDKDRSYQ
jgi:ATP-dependent Lon protease